VKLREVKAQEKITTVRNPFADLLGYLPEITCFSFFFLRKHDSKDIYNVSKDFSFNCLCFSEEFSFAITRNTFLIYSILT